MPRVQILYFDSCPNWQEARALVEQVARDAGVDTQVELVRVEDAEQAERLRFLGSPTIRVDGRDIEPGADTRRDYVLACRVYRRSDGTASLPPAELIGGALTC